MDCCQIEALEATTESWAAETLDQYRAGRLGATTTILLEDLTAYDLAERQLLDIGGGIGILQFELFKEGITHATSVEASSAYLRAAQDVADEQGMADRITNVHANFVDVADSVPDADVVTLDRVICCYHDVHKLVSRSAARARWLYAVSYPVDSLWNRFMIVAENFLQWLKRDDFRAFIHPTRTVDQLAGEAGLDKVSHRTVWEWPHVWQVDVYERSGA